MLKHRLMRIKSFKARCAIAAEVMRRFFYLAKTVFQLRSVFPEWNIIRLFTLYLFS